MLHQLRGLLRAMRPRQWAKNGILYFALIYSLNQRWRFSEPMEALEVWGVATAAAALFCLAASATYLVNDLLDAPRDRLHPDKRGRSIASGQTPPWMAAAAAAAMGAGSLGLALWLQPLFGAAVAVYLALTLAYSAALKRAPVADVAALAGVYVLRAVAGAWAIAVPISPWLYAVMALGAAMIVLGKRRGELAAAGPQDAARQRAVLGVYTLTTLDWGIRASAAALLAVYVAYAFVADGLPGNGAMALTVPVAVAGLFRYHLLLRRAGGESPEEMFLRDRPMQALALLGLAVTLAALASGR